MKHQVLAALAAGALCTAAFANTWVEIPDAGDFPAGTFQPTVGTGPLLWILGATNVPQDDYVDSFCIRITDPDAFMATTSNVYDPDNFTNWDTRLYLWDIDGNMIMANDDAPNDSVQSLLTQPPFFPGSLVNDPGYVEYDQVYIISITGYPNDAMDANNTPLATFSPFSALHGQNPAAGPFDHWENPTSTAYGEYQIGLAGCTFCTPAPGALALLGLAGLIGRRRR